MNVEERNRLSQEARLQTKALNRISRWKMIALSVSTVGVACFYTGCTGQHWKLFFSICGLLLLFAGAGSAAVLNLGLENGRRNVEKIISLLDGEKQ